MVEAAYSLQVDYDCSCLASISGYSKLWGWSRNKVRTFLKNMGVEIDYPDRKMSPKGGQVRLQAKDKQGTSKGQVRLIDSRCFDEQRDKLWTSRGQVVDKMEDTTKDPNPNPDPEEKNYPEAKGSVSEMEKKELVMSVPLKGSGEFCIVQSDIDEWGKSYPGVDVIVTLMAIVQWNRDNPKKRKTKAGIRKHISGWLKREQDKQATRLQKGKNDKHDNFNERNYQAGATPDEELPSYLRG